MTRYILSLPWKHEIEITLEEKFPDSGRSNEKLVERDYRHGRNNLLIPCSLYDNARRENESYKPLR